MLGGSSLLWVFNRLAYSQDIAAIDILFQWSSALSTCGFGTVSVSSWNSGTKLLMILVMLVGGTAGSTAGVTSPDMPWLGKLTLICLMWIGRLEIISVLLLFSLPIKLIPNPNNSSVAFPEKNFSNRYSGAETKPNPLSSIAFTTTPVLTFFRGSSRLIATVVTRIKTFFHR